LRYGVAPCYRCSPLQLRIPIRLTNVDYTKAASIGQLAKRTKQRSTSPRIPGPVAPPVQYSMAGLRGREHDPVGPLQLRHPTRRPPGDSARTRRAILTA